MRPSVNRSQSLIACAALIAAASSLLLRGQSKSNDADLSAIRSLITQKQFATAESQLRAINSRHPDFASGHFLLGYVLFSEKKAKESLAEYTQGAKYRAPGADDLMAVAADYILLDDNTDADTWLTRVTQMQPLNAQAWYYLGRTRFYESRYDDAIAVFKKCLELNSRDVKAQTNLGLSLMELRRDAEATAALQQAIQWTKEDGDHDAQPYLDLGSLLTRSDKFEEALPYLERAAVIEGDNPKTHEELGRAYEKLHRNNDAEVQLRRAVELAPDASSLHYELGRILKAEGRNAEAEKEFAVTGKLNGARSSREVPNFDLHN